jgi:hypothetical protein
MNGFKAFAVGFGATAGVILGVYAGIKGIETIGYFSCKKDEYNEKKFKAQLDAVVREHAAEKAVA